MSNDPKTRYPNLLSPIKVGPMTLKHRATMSAHGMGLNDRSGGVGERLHNYVVTRAQGGAAMLGTESAPIHQSTSNRSLNIRLYTDEVVPSLRKLSDGVRAAGGKLSITLWHGGHNVTYIEGQAAVSSSPIPSITRETPRAITPAEIRELIAAYADATRRCREAGLDAVEVQTATSYLLGSFLSPAMNHRTDSYGGSFENRTRIVREICEAVREAAGPNMAVGVRTSTSHHIPYAPVDYKLEESVAAMKMLADGGLVDWVSVISGSRWAGHETIPPMNMKRNQLAEEAKAFKKAFDVPVIVAGRIRSAADAEEMIASGCADIVAMARTWVAEPEWANKIIEGREDMIRPCMSCNQACAGFVFKGIPGSCVLNPTAGREGELPLNPEPAAKPKTIAVVGGGPAGMEAARVAAARGHRVTLYEAQDKLGGQMRLAAEAPHREEMRDALTWWETELRQRQVEIKLGTKVASASDVDADEVVWALGAEPGPTAVWRLRPWLHDGIPGTADLPHGREILRGDKSASGNVLIIDEEGGWSAISLAETLAAQSDVSKVTVATTEVTWGEADLTFTRELPAITARTRAAGIEVVGAAVVEAVEDGSVSTRDGRTLGPFDAIVLATGTVATAFPEGGNGVGDCLSPRGIWGATHDAAKLARTL
jgi:2,4-dienoyl-CoA reductase (NADPH2)